MLRDIRVIIIEDDPYARDFMSVLLRRDWRTRVVGEFLSGEGVELQKALHEPGSPVEVLVVDTEALGETSWPRWVAQMARSLAEPPAILFTCTFPEHSGLSLALEAQEGGYISKKEIRYGLAAAVSAVAQGQFVITPSVLKIAEQFILPPDTQVMDGMLPVATFTRREEEISRLGLLFNLTQRDIADDLVVSPDFVAEVMGQVYEKLGLRELLAGEKPLEDYFRDELLLARCQSLLEKAGVIPGQAIHHAPWMSTIAFHLLTRPEVEPLGKS